MNVFPSEKHSTFLTIERYDIELTNIKISDKNIVPPGGPWVPELPPPPLCFVDF